MHRESGGDGGVAGVRQTEISRDRQKDRSKTISASIMRLLPFLPHENTGEFITGCPTKLV